MRASAVFLGVLGASAIFLPQEILARAGTAPVEFTVLLVQLAGALYFGFGVLNWMAQGNIIGGIYSRPVAIGNLAHFTIGALSILKSVAAGQRAPEVLVGAAAYTIFAVLFAVLAFGHSPRAGGQA
jgi:hypothetical protein